MPNQRPYETELPFHKIDAVKLAADMAEINASRPKPRPSLNSVFSLKRNREVLVSRIAERTALAEQAATRLVDIEKLCKEQAKKLRKISKMITADANRPGVGMLRKSLVQQEAIEVRLIEDKEAWTRAYKVHTSIAESTQKQLDIFDATDGKVLNALLEEEALLASL